MPYDCEEASLIRRSGLGLIHEDGDIRGMRDILVELWRAWCEGRSPVEPDFDFIERFSIRSLPEKLRTVLIVAGIGLAAHLTEDLHAPARAHD